MTRRRALVATDRAALMLQLVPYLIGKGEVSIAEAAAEFDVTPEQMRTMVEKLTVIGLPGDGGYWQMPNELFDIDWELLDEQRHHRHHQLGRAGALAQAHRARGGGAAHRPAARADDSRRRRHRRCSPACSRSSPAARRAPRPRSSSHRVPSTRSAISSPPRSSARWPCRSPTRPRMPRRRPAPSTR